MNTHTPGLPRRLDSRRPWRWATIAVSTLTVALLTLPAGAETFERRVEASSKSLVTVSNLSGSVEVQGWDKAEVEVLGDIDSRIHQVEVSVRGERIEIEVVYERGRFNFGGDADLRINMPTAARLEVETVSADIAIARLTGEVELESVSGGVEIRDRPTSVRAESVSGDIDLRDGAARVSAETVSGAVVVTGQVADLEASSVSGAVRLERTEDLRRAEVEVVSGEIQIDASLAADARLSASSHSGSVVIRLPESTSARIRATTFSGDIRNDLGPPAQRTSRYSPGEELDFTLGSGTARIDLESYSGTVSLRRR